jgi:error-prone DNA polymerase
VAGGANGAVDGAAAAAFAAGIAARTGGKVLWCLTQADLFAPALAQSGLTSDRVVFFETSDEKTVLGGFEEALRSGGLSAVVAEIGHLSLKASQRLQFAAETTGTLGIALRRWRRQTDARDFGTPTAASTRWRVTELASEKLPVRGVGRARWLLELMRARGGDCADFEVEAFDATGHLGLPAHLMSAMRRGLDLLREHKGIDLNLATIPAEDPRTYAMIRRADTMGTFQIESRAQMSMLPRIKPRTFYDLVVEVAIVRPGPIQGDMVHPYLRRREGKEPVTYPSPALEAVLSKTLGVPLFQEQAMRVVMVAAGFSAARADLVRRAMATFKHTGGVHKFRDEIVEGMLRNGYTQDYAEQLFGQLQGFGSYGFPESHAASFALIAYASSWLKCHHPEVFLAALLDSQPMGFYAPAQLIRNAQEHGVEVRPVCVNRSRWDSTLEPDKGGQRFAVRLGFRMIKGLRNMDMATLVAARGETPFKSLYDLWRRSGVPISTLQTLARADAFKPAFALERREALFALKGMRDEPLPLFADLLDDDGAHQAEIIEPDLPLKPMTTGHSVVEDYNTQGFCLNRHPVYFLREELTSRGLMSCQEAIHQPDSKYVKVAGLVLVRQRPGSANGVTFMTIEDETTDMNIIVWEKTGQIYRRILLTSGLIEVSGQIQKEGQVIHLIARSLNDLSPLLQTISQRDVAMTLPHQPGDEFRNGRPPADARVARPAQGPEFVRSRDFR